MSKCFAISTARGKHLGTIICDRIERDSDDGELMFIEGTKCVAMFCPDDIQISTAESRSNGQNVQTFAEYQSNRV